MSDIATDKSLLVHRTVGTMLACLIYHVYIVLVAVFTLVGRLVHGSDLLVCFPLLVGCCCLLLLLAPAYPITSDGCAALR